MNQSISEESKKKWEKKYSAFKASLYALNDGEVIDSVVKTMDYILSQAITAERKELRERVTGAVARGWCHDKNSMKEMDSDLAEAIIEEVLSLLEGK